jgi:hypothetical protein
VSGSHTKTQKKGTPDSDKNLIIIISEECGGETHFKNPTVMTSLTAKWNKPYSFWKDKKTQIFEQAIKNGLPLLAYKRPDDIRKVEEGDSFVWILTNLCADIRSKMIKNSNNLYYDINFEFRTALQYPLPRTRRWSPCRAGGSQAEVRRGCSAAKYCSAVSMVGLAADYCSAAKLL